jgi:hypothetical protein
MAAANYNFSIEKGTSFVISFQYLDSNNTPINLTNWCARLRWIDNTGTINTYYTSSTNEDYSFTLEPMDGKILFQIPAVKTAAITWTSARYDLDLQEPTNLYSSSLQDNKKVFRILEGSISVVTPNIDVYEQFACPIDSAGSCGTCPQ